MLCGFWFGDHHVELPAALDVLQEGVLLDHGRLQGHEVAALLELVGLALLLDRLDHGHGLLRQDGSQRRLHGPHRVVVPVFVPIPDFDLECPVIVPVADGLHAHGGRFPLRVQVVPNVFRLVHLDPTPILTASLDGEEWVGLVDYAPTVLVRQLKAEELEGQEVGRPVDLLARDRDGALLPLAGVVYQLEGHGVAVLREQLAQSELDTPLERVVAQILGASLVLIVQLDYHGLDLCCVKCVEGA